VVRFVAGCLASLSDRPGDARRHWDGLIARLDDPRPIRGLDAATRSYYEAASLYALGNLECWRDKNLSRTLALADRLEKQPLELYRLSAHQIRANYFAQQGAMEEAARHSARVELCALQRGMTWQVEIWGPCNTVSLATRLRDAMASKPAAQLRQLSADTPSLRGFVDYGRASYLLLRNRPEEALPLLEAWLARRSPEDVGYANLVGLTAQAYNALGRHAEAARITGQALARLRPEDFDFPALTLRVAIEAALARAGLGQLDDAAAQLDALIARHVPNEGPLTLGALHDARANVALRAGDEPAASRHVDEMARWYRGTDCPGLIQHCDRIARRWARSCGAAAEGAPLPTMSLLANFGSRLTSPPGEEASSELLAELVRGTGASDGVLVYLRRDGSRKRLQHSREPLPERLEAFMDERMRAGLVDTTVTERSEDDELEDPNLRMLDGKLWRVALLVSERGDGEAQVGAVALSYPLVALPRDVARAVAEHLQSDAAHSTRAPTIRP